MLEYLNNIAPNTTQRFLSDIMYNYGIGAAEFEKKTIYNRLIEVRRYFGYSAVADLKMSEKQVKDEIIALFTDYEDLILRYPNGVPDPLKQMKEFTNQQKSDYIDKHYTRQINMCLHHAMVKYTGKRVSLKDALVDRVLTAVEVKARETVRKQQEDEKFWNDVIKNFDPNEIPPF